MAIETIKMPQLGEGITEATIIQWLKQPGESIEAYEALVEVVTDKVTTEIPSLFEGVVREQFYSVDEVVAMGQPIATIEVEGEATSDSAPVEPEVELKEAPQRLSLNRKAHGGNRYSPAVLTLAQVHQLDIEQIESTGREGRVTRQDMLRYLESRGSQEVNQPLAPRPQVQPVEIIEEISQPVRGDNVTEHPVSAVRQAIAKNMVNSVSQIPHAWTMVEVDATALVKLRHQLKTNFQRTEGYSLSYLAFFIKIVAQALKENPLLNSEWAGSHIVEHHDINISLAIAANELLYVPVIKHADEKSVKGIAREIADLITKAHNNQLTTADMSGGTFTVNSTGSFGSIMSQGIINHPQAGILQVEAIVKRPMFYQEGIAIRDMVNLCLSIDHRVLDGAAAGKFLQGIKGSIEQIDIETFSIY